MRLLLRFVLAAVLCICWGDLVLGQVTVAFQGGEGTAADNWGFVAPTNAGGPTPPGIVTALPRTGTRALRAGGGSNVGCSGGSNCISGGGATGCPMHGNTLQFNAINTQCLTGVELSVYHRSHTFCSGSGLDNGDFVYFEVRLNGGAWTTVETLGGSGDYTWTYTTATAGTGANTVPNPFVYSVPAGTNSFEFRVRCTINRADEVFYLDDVRLTTTSTAYSFPGTAGLWMGTVNTNWFEPCNWNDRTVPTAATNVTFPTNSSNDCVIQAGQNCVCNNITFTGSAGGRRLRAENGANKVLTVRGNLLINTTAGSNVLNFSDGANGTPDGTLNLHGNWTNNSDAGDFGEGESRVNLVGTGNQVITLGTAQMYEGFYNLDVNKSSGDVLLADHVEVDGVLSLVSGNVVTGAQHVYVGNNASGAVVNHSTASYVEGNLRRAVQAAGTVSYDYPVGTASFYELATLELNNGGVSWVEGFFNPTIGGAAPNVMESGVPYDMLLNAGVWNFVSDLPYAGTYTATLHERGYTNGGAAAYIDVRRDNAGALWDNPGTHVSWVEAGGVVTCVRDGMGPLDDLGIAFPSVPLAYMPVDLRALHLGDGQVRVWWTSDPDYYTGAFELVRVDAAGELGLGDWNGDGQAEFERLDAGMAMGLVEYQLYYTDRNGNRELVGQAHVLLGSEGLASPLLWPNPYRGHVNLLLPAEGVWVLEVVRIDGAVVWSGQGEKGDAEGQFEAVAPQLGSGAYVLRMRNGMKGYSLRFVHP